MAGYACSCAPGYEGRNCAIDLIDCLPNPCLNGGSCTVSTSPLSACFNNLLPPTSLTIPVQEDVAGYTCSCAPGYEGRNCAMDTDNCEPNPCLNGGSCMVSTSPVSACFNNLFTIFFTDHSCAGRCGWLCLFMCTRLRGEELHH